MYVHLVDVWNSWQINYEFSNLAPTAKKTKSQKMLVSNKTTDSHLADVDFFRLSRIFSSIFGVWPLQGSLPIRFYVNIVSLWIAAVFGVAYGFAHLDNLFFALDSWCGSMFEFVSACKTLFLWYHYKDCKRMLENLYGYYKQSMLNHFK